MEEIINENNDEIRGEISNINYDNIKKNKFKLQVKSFILASIMYFTGMGAVKSIDKGASNTNNTSPINLNQNQIVAGVSVDVNYDDTIIEIADRFYNDDYENVYGSKENFVDSIKLQNAIANDKIIVGQKLTIPAIIDTDNPYFQNVMQIKAKINELEQNQKWIKYTVQLDDSLALIARLGSGSNLVGIDEMNEIATYNRLQSNIIYPGQELYIINPELGNLKKELKEAEEEFRESLTNNQKSK